MKPRSQADLDDGYRKALDNARALVVDAQLLLSHGRHPRAYCLAQLACEEVGKTLMLSAAALDLQQGRQVDWKRLGDRFRDHISKGLARLVTEALRARNVAALPGALDEAQVLNRLKNQSLYVDDSPSGFQTPSDAITPERAEALVSAADELVTMFEQADEALQGNREAFTKSPAFAKWNHIQLTLARRREP